MSSDENKSTDQPDTDLRDAETGPETDPETSTETGRETDTETDTEALAATVATASERPDRQAPAGEPSAERPVRRTRVVLAAAAGAGVIGLLAGGGIGWAVGHHGADGASASSGASLSLPGSLSNGFQRSTSIDSRLKPAVTSAQQTLGAGTDMAIYAKGKSQLLVEATRLPGSALLQAGMSYAKVGDATCASTQSAQGTEAICTRSDDALTVKVTAGTSDEAAKYADEVYTALA